MQDIVDCLLYGRESNTKYNENVRKFALTLYFYSPRAYKYIREKCWNHLPHHSTIRKWYANSSVSGARGFCNQSFEILTDHANKLKTGGTEPVCSLIFDEMAIRKHLQWSTSQKNFLGQISYGFRPDCADVPLATNALVFMLNGINFDMTLPVAYYFINWRGKNKVLVDGDKQNIKWEYFESLESLRVRNDLSHVHKLTRKHIRYKNSIMKVRVACETLSNSVANSMEGLMEKGYKQFANSTATIRYIRCINDCFDIMNTKDIKNENKFKNALNPENKSEVFAFFEHLSGYLQQIKFPKGQYVFDSPVRTAFRGLIINVANFKSIYEEYVESNLQPFLPTFRFSQDLLESFFGRIRSLPGCNDNPTVEQFCASFKKIVVCNEIWIRIISND